MKNLIKLSTDTDDTKWQAPSTTPLKAIKPLTRKQQAFTRYLIENPKASATEAASIAYNVNNRNTAATVAVENMRKPAILTELAKHSATSEFTLLEVMQYSKEYGRDNSKQGASYASVAASIANSVLDRLHGKATSVIEAHTSAVVLNIDLTGTTSHPSE